MTGRSVTTVLLLSVLAAAAGACRPPGNDHPPDQLLRDSLGLTEEDQVFRVELSAPENRERAAPSLVEVPPGAFVEFVTMDRRLHIVTFETDSLSAAAAEFLRGRGQDASPPLIELGSRFVVSFREAPPGRYPYTLGGNGEEGRGAVVVAAPGEDR